MVAQFAKGTTKYIRRRQPVGLPNTVRQGMGEGIVAGHPVWARAGQVLAKLTLTVFRTDQNKTHEVGT